MLETIQTDSECIGVVSLSNKTDFYTLRLKGDSMREEGVFDGDIIIIKRQASA